MIIDSELDNRKIQTFEYETTAVSDGKIIGTCELGKAEIQMLNSSNEYSTLKGQWINTIHGSFYIYNVEPVQEKVSIKLSCYDIKYKLDTPYDSSLYINLFPCTLKQWRNAIFTNLGLTYDNSNFPNSGLTLASQPYVKEGASNRDVIKMIAEAGCSWVETNSTNKFYFRWFENTTYQVNDWTELTTEKETTSAINTVVLGRGDVEDNVYCPTTLPENPVEFRIDNNYILDPQDTTSSTDLRYTTILPIYQRVNGFSYLIFSMKTQQVDNKLSIKLGQKVSFKDIWNNSLTAYVMTKKISYLGGNQSVDDNYEITLSASEIKESSTDYSYGSSIENDVLKVSRKADKNEGMILDLVSKTTIVSNSINNTGSVTLKNAHAGLLHKLSISGNISLLFPQSESNLYGYPLVPSDDLVPSDTLTPSSPVPYGNEVLYPSSTLYPRSSVLVIDDKEYTLDFDFLNYLNTETYDEFIYQDGACKIIRRVGIDSSGNKYALDNEITEIRKDVVLEVNSNSIIKLKSFTNAIYNVTYLLENEYTENFATQVEVQSQITQTNNKIEATVKEIADDDGEVTAASLILAINKDESNAEINADKISLKGKTIDLSGDDVSIAGKVLSVNSNGEMKLVDTGSDNDEPSFTIEKGDGSDYTDAINKIFSDAIMIESKFLEGTMISMYFHRARPHFDILESGVGMTTMMAGSIGLTNENIQTFYSNYLETYVQNLVYSSISQRSLVSLKKNINNYNKNALELIKNGDIYEFNYKTEKDEDKKHVGFVIGNEYNTPSEFISKQGDGIDISNVVGILVKAIQEQQVEIENLKKEMEELKNGFDRISK